VLHENDNAYTTSGSTTHPHNPQTGRSTCPPEGGIYAGAVDLYRDRGWPGVLPVPEGKKSPVPAGFTGWTGGWPEESDYRLWQRTRPDGNVALRVPEDVVGFDVDHYGKKHGFDTLTALEKQWGRLPSTFISSSRTKPSGIRWFRTDGRVLQGQAGPGIEVIQFHHRYAIVAPSIHPDTGKPYGWYRETDLRRFWLPLPISQAPSPDELARMPASWLEGLAAGSSECPPHGAAPLSVRAVEDALDATSGQKMSPQVKQAEMAILEEMAVGSRHDAVVRGTSRLVRLAVRGLGAGAADALGKVYDAFFDGVTSDGSRTEEEAGAELRRIYLWALDRVAAEINVQGEDDEVSDGTVSRAVLISVSDVKAEEVSWLWPGRLPRGKVVVLDGDPGLGKSTMTLDVAARATRGSEWPDGGFPEPGAVVLCSAEDGVADTIRPRLEAAGADLDKVSVLVGSGSSEEDCSPVFLPDDVDAIRDAVERTDAVLVIIDPMMAFLDGKVNSYRDQDVRLALRPLSKIAEETGATVLVVRHLTKTAGPNPLYRGGGSIGITGAARVVMVVGEDPDDKGARVLAVIKSNLGEIPPSLKYSVRNHVELTCGHIQWEGTSPHTGADILTPPRQRQATARDAAEIFLEESLSVGGRPVADLKAAAEKQGISQRTLERAAGNLGVVSTRRGFGPGSHQEWSLPHSRHEGGDGEYGEHEFQSHQYDDPISRQFTDASQGPAVADIDVGLTPKQRKMNRGS